jgi:hypothetical protein
MMTPSVTGPAEVGCAEVGRALCESVDMTAPFDCDIFAESDPIPQCHFAEQFCE